ncbi:hypothetical protein B0H14DRAFT_3895604 [Mycena olivaceomarginata]|nr:hypothetical protein B0H14DRAFT_3895604 [Mycena olivaceomarginata]
MTTTASILSLEVQQRRYEDEGRRKEIRTEEGIARRREQGSGGRTGVQQGRDETAKLSSNGWGAAFGALHCSRAVTSSLHGEASHTHGSVLHSPCVDDSSTLRDSAVLATPDSVSLCTSVRPPALPLARPDHSPPLRRASSPQPWGLSPGAGAPHLAAQHAAATLKNCARALPSYRRQPLTTTSERPHPLRSTRCTAAAPGMTASFGLHHAQSMWVSPRFASPRTHTRGTSCPYARVRVLSHTAMIWLCKPSTGHADDRGVRAERAPHRPSQRRRNSPLPRSSSLSGRLRARLFGSLTSPSCFYRTRRPVRAPGPADSTPHARVLGGHVNSEEAPRWIATAPALRSQPRACPRCTPYARAPGPIGSTPAPSLLSSGTARAGRERDAVVLGFGALLIGAPQGPHPGAH